MRSLRHVRVRPARTGHQIVAASSHESPSRRCHNLINESGDGRARMNCTNAWRYDADCVVSNLALLRSHECVQYLDIHTHHYGPFAWARRRSAVQMSCLVLFRLRVYSSARSSGGSK